MANTFLLIAQQSLEFQGQHYEPGDRFVASWVESPSLKRSGAAILAPEEEQRAYGSALPRVMTAAVTAEAPRRARRTYRRRDLKADE